LVKEDQRFNFEKLCVLILVSALGNPKAHVDNYGLLLQIASQCPKFEAIMIGNSQNWIGLLHALSSNTSIILQ